MTRATFSCLIAVGLGLATPRPVQASIGGLADYIGGLSGPGPFRPKTGTYFVDIVCLEAKVPSPEVEKALEDHKPVPLSWLLLCPGDLRAARQSYGFFTGSYQTTDIPTDYHYPQEKLSLSRGITATTVGLTFKTTIPFVANQRWLRSIDIGVTAGVIVLKSDATNGETLFKTFDVTFD